ncbi:MAG: ATP-binding protein, partial [Corynebacterium marinum]|nr:ATP-binding protein [Corynebacterium marinum]
KSAQSVFAAVETACGEVEDLFGVRIAPVTVGEDTALTEDTKAVVLAAREAMVNAAKHAGVEKLDVYAEILAGELSIFVRDRGAGFDPADIPADRHGIRDSIEGRMERIGGQARIRSTAGEGTEVSVTYRLPVS